MSIAIAFGGNIGDEAQILERFVHAREALAQLGPVRSASIYRTAPIGPDQPAYLNTAVLVRAPDVQPGELVATTQEIERLLGRDRSREVHWGPRTLDLDILAWGDRVIDTPELRVPHPRLGERRFALQPLVDLLGEEAHVPRIGRLGDALARVRAQSCEFIRQVW
ncbi:MAG TPA: 2-amino-4-hydroxy-6-hydroxymethyldihydropteridine diphosphokinase [Kofleriaceae bacterium]